MKKIITILFFLVALSACDNDQTVIESTNVDLTETNFKGAVFEDWDSFYEYAIFLERQEDEYSVLFETRENNFKSFLSIVVNSDNDDELKIADELSYGLMGIFNANLQFMIGDKIISYKDGNFVESNYDFSTFKIINNIKISTEVLVMNDKTPNLEATLYVNGNNTAGYSDDDFWRTRYLRCSDNAQILGTYSRQHRFTQQLKSLDYDGTRFLFIETKLLYRDSRNRLKYATTEERNYTYSVSGTLSIATSPWNNNVTSSVNFQKTVNCTKSNWNRQDISNGGVFPVPAGNNWGVNLTGTITHHINGDTTNNKWYAPVNWN